MSFLRNVEDLKRKNKQMDDIRGVYKFYWDCGRQGDLSGVFVATRQQIKNIIGKDVSFGEVLGKHSEIYGVLEEVDITLLTEEPIAVRNFEDFGFENGYNPLHYIEYEEETCE